jgi:hypothetical protein
VADPFPGLAVTPAGAPGATVTAPVCSKLAENPAEVRSAAENRVALPARSVKETSAVHVPCVAFQGTSMVPWYIPSWAVPEIRYISKLHCSPDGVVNQLTGVATPLPASVT